MQPENPRERLIVEMEGLPSSDGKPSLSAFISAVKALEGLINEVAKRQTGEKAELFIEQLSQSSPSLVEIAHRGGNGDAGRILADVQKNLCAVAEGKTEGILAREYDAIGKVIKPFEREKLGLLRIQRANGSTLEEHPAVNVDAEYVANYNHGRETELCGVTTVSGLAEMLDLRPQKRIKLMIHPDIGTGVVLRLDRNHAEAEKKALQAIGKHVSVTGDVRYRLDDKNSQRPYRIDAAPEQIEILKPSNKGWRDFKKLRGAFPGMTGGKDSVKYVRELRGDDG